MSSRFEMFIWLIFAMMAMLALAQEESAAVPGTDNGDSVDERHYHHHHRHHGWGYGGYGGYGGYYGGYGGYGGYYPYYGGGWWREGDKEGVSGVAAVPIEGEAPTGPAAEVGSSGFAPESNTAFRTKRYALPPVGYYYYHNI